MNIDNRITAVMCLRQAKRVVAFTGAGISAESGIPTFRDSNGFWQRFPPEQFATWRGLLDVAVRDPRAVAEFVLNVIDPIATATFNAGHEGLFLLERHVQTTIVTQNIDGLHQAAGSGEVLEIHGSLLEVIHATRGEIVHRFTRDELIYLSEILRGYIDRRRSLASCGLELRRIYPWDWLGQHRPNLVLFGDSLAEPAWTKAIEAVEQCDVLISVGTSGVVYPAAILPAKAIKAGATVIAIDPQPMTGCWLQGSAGDVLPALVRDAFMAK